MLEQFSSRWIALSLGLQDSQYVVVVHPESLQKNKKHQRFDGVCVVDTSMPKSVSKRKIVLWRTISQYAQKGLVELQSIFSGERESIFVPCIGTDL